VAAQGAKGLSELSGFNHNWDDERYFPYYEKIQAKGLVALFHSMATSPRTSPEHLLAVATRFPRLQMICAHMGHPNYGIPAEIARLRSNFHVEISGSMLLKFQSFPSKMKEYLWWDGPNPHSPVDVGYAFDSLLFATDEPPDHLAKCISQYETILQACGVPEKSRKNIFGGTLARILGIPERT
jgi:predicted TIM-barrel fold metal-dependent hydrolase